MLSELPYAVLLAGGIITGMYFANLMYDTGKIPHHVSRKLSHIAGGVALILCPFVFSSFWWPLILSSGFTLLLLYTHQFSPGTFRGTGGAGRLQAFAEVHYPATAIPIILLGWGYFHQPWLAITPLLYLAFGDAVTGLVRNKIYKREVKGNAGSIAMFFVCCLLAYFMKPYYIGLVGAVIATLAEKYTPTKQYLDDNLTVPILSFVVMAITWLVFVK